MAKTAATRAPIPEPTLSAPLAWIGPVVAGGATGLAVPVGTAGAGGVVTPGAAGVGGLAGTGVTDTSGIVVVPGAVTG
jgi:hypothetical protein